MFIHTTLPNHVFLAYNIIDLRQLLLTIIAGVDLHSWCEFELPLCQTQGLNPPVSPVWEAIYAWCARLHHTDCNQQSVIKKH